LGFRVYDNICPMDNMALAWDTLQMSYTGTLNPEPKDLNLRP